MELKKFFLCCLFVVFICSPPALAKPGYQSRPEGSGAWLSEIDSTVEKLIASNKESSRKMEEMTSEIKLLTETLVWLTWLLILITLLPFAGRFCKRLLSWETLNIVRKKKKKAYPAYRLRRRKLQVR